MLVIDLDPSTQLAASREPFDVVGPDQLGIDRRELLRMAGIYDVLELSTAIKPWLLRWMLAADPEPVVYLDPDIELFAPIDAATAHARECGIVLTPHTISPLPLDEYGPNELTILQSGTYNLGFIAVSDQAETFLDWWAERLRRDCLISKEEGLFVDQRWVDLVPNYFDPYVLREPGWNVAYWNIPARDLSRGANGYTVNGDPLRFFHYSGFDPNRPERLSFYQGESPKVRLEEHPILAEVCRNYADKLIQSGHRATFRTTYTYDRTPTGLRLDARARRIYRRELVRSERHERPEPPNPFDTRRPDAFERWLNEMTGPQEVTRYLRALYQEREDVRHAFPDIDGADARLFVDWVRETGAPHTGIPDRLVPRPVHPTDVAGADVSGYMSAENGVGEAARQIVKIFEAADVPHTILNYRNTRSRQDLVVQDTDTALFEIKVVCVNADQLPTFAADSPQDWTAGYTVGFWSWEVETFPAWMADAQMHVDEVWANSEHAADAIRDAIDKPVFVLPPPIEMPSVRRKSRSALGLPEGFMFLFCFDFDSVFERKNPIAVVEAFRRAFPTPSGPQLVIKTVRGEGHPDQFARLRGAIAGRPDIHLMNGYLDAADHAAVVASCDAYVSLHRAEGFGFTMAEAMALAKPVVATGYSGNLEFMDDTNSWLIPYGLVQIPDGCDPYPGGSFWAEPDIETAASAIREIVADPSAAAERGAHAAADIARLHQVSSRVPFVVDRFEAIAALRQLWQLGDDGHPWSRVESVEHYLGSGPDIESPTRYGFFSRLARRVVMRSVRHFAEHQDRLHTSLADSVRELQARLAAEAAVVRELEAKIRDLEGSVGGRRPEQDAQEGFGRVIRPARERR